MTENWAVSREEALEVAESLGVQYFETSAKDNINIEQTFEALVGSIYKMMLERESKKKKERKHDSKLPSSSGRY